MIQNVRLIEIIEANNEEARSYSGRAMHGKRCVSFNTDDAVLMTLGAMVEECADLNEAAWLVAHAKTDDMGLGTVIYWPAVPWPSESKERP